MRSQIHAFLSQPLLMDPTFAIRLAAYADDKSPDMKGLFINAPCPKLAAEAAATTAKATGQGKKLTAVIPIYGLIDQHASDMLDWMGGTSCDSLAAAWDVCMNEDRINNVLFDIHSPGGTVYGVKETADMIFSGRGKKVACSVANSMMASAAYYLGSACDRVYATPGADVGSVGVYQMHFDQSKLLDEIGIKATIIREPEFKAEGNPYEPLTEAATQEMKSDVHRIYQQFTGDVGRYRGLEAGVVRETFGKGRTMDSASAQKVGMINRVATFGDVLGRMQAGTIRPGSANNAADDWDAAPVTELPAGIDAGQRRRKLSMVGLAFPQ